MEKLLSRNNLMMIAVFVILYYVLKANGVLGRRPSQDSKPAV